MGYQNFDGYKFKVTNIFDIIDFLNNHKDKIEDMLFDDKLTTISNQLCKIIINIRKGLDIKDSYNKSDINLEYKEHYKNLELIFLLEYNADQKVKDMSEQIILMPIKYNNKQEILCLLNIKNVLIKEYLIEESKEIMDDYYYTSSIINKSDFNIRKEMWNIASENNDYIKHNLQYTFRSKNLDNLSMDNLLYQLNTKIKKCADNDYMMEEFLCTFDINDKIEIIELNEKQIQMEKDKVKCNKKCYEIELKSEMLKWTFNEFYNYFKNNIN